MNKRNLPVYRIINGARVRVPDDLRDPTRRYSHGIDAHGEEYLQEFTDQEERERDEEIAQWEAEAPLREAEELRRRDMERKFRASLKYEDRLVAFLDVLGWSEAVRKSATDSITTEQLGVVVDELRQRTRGNEALQGFAAGRTIPGDPQITHFSDCIAISTCSDLASKLWLLNEIGHLTMRLLENSFLVRGGISHGPLFHRDSILFGPAHLAAYELESRYAIYPRIIVDRGLSEAWGQGDRYLDETEVRVARTWRRDRDGFWFFDFLQPFCGLPHFDESPHLKAMNLNLLRKVIISESSKTDRSDLRAIQKIDWLTSYFNEVCRESTGHGVEPIEES